MSWFIFFFNSSIGKKILMAFTGLGFCFFLTIHLIGNLTLYGGEKKFLSYVTNLHNLGIIITIAELGLLCMAIAHITTGITLFYQNYHKRPIKYAVKKNAGGRTIGSATMPYTGIFLIIFIFWHLLTFHFVEKTQYNIYQIMTEAFKSPFYITFYLFAVIIVALHISHGFWSAFQTLGIDHPKYTLIIKGFSLIFSLIIGIGFCSIPLYLAISI